MLQNKKILLGVCGSIAAYKAASLVRLLKKNGAEVKVIMTSSAFDFITPLTLATLSKNPVLSKFSSSETGEWNNHVELGLWADFVLIAPASANTIAKMSTGQCDNLLLATYLSAKCPVYIAPAMDLDMYAHPSHKKNLKTLIEYGNNIIEAESGELASGLEGQGRMAEPENIIVYLQKALSKKKVLEGKNVLITAGPTYEAIDPVRFIGNHSSGKMGYALAHELAELGANINLISGPTNEKVYHNNITLKNVTSAQQMYKACEKCFDKADLSILAAAVADYTPLTVADQKIKKSGENLNIQLKKTTDIAQSLGGKKRKDQIIIGFALETEHEVDNAQKKIKSKNFDLIVLNSLNDKGAGFGHDTNKISIINRDNKIENFELKSKREVAADIVQTIINKFYA